MVSFNIISSESFISECVFGEFKQLAKRNIESIAGKIINNSKGAVCRINETYSYMPLQRIVYNFPPFLFVVLPE
jgi:hypothetical protein